MQKIKQKLKDKTEPVMLYGASPHGSRTGLDYTFSM